MITEPVKYNMGLLENYREQHPEAFRDKPKWESPREYGFFIRLVMRLSAGRIHDVNTASYVLLGAAVFIMIVAVVVIFSSFNLLPPPRFSEEQAKKQMEEYKKIQPF